VDVFEISIHSETNAKVTKLHFQGPKLRFAKQNKKTNFR